MLAAVPEYNGHLGMLRLILRLVADRADVPSSLRQHLLDSIGQALALVDQQRITGAADREAVDLALDLRDDALLNELQRVTDFDSISADLATRLLEKLQQEPA